MIVERLVVGMFMENAWVVGCESGREAVIIDPGDEAERIAAVIDRHGLTPLRILNTHAHLDHVGAVSELAERYGIPFGIHEGERDNLEHLAAHAAAFGLDAPLQPVVDEWITEGQVFPFGEQTLTVMETPGHSAGGVSFRADGLILAGDTLFQGSIGRTDLPGGDFETLRRSIREKLFALDPETVVHCGHGPDTTIAMEKASNPFVGGGADPSQFGLL